MKLLYISNFLPYNKIRHAGGKTFYNYVNAISSYKDVEITVIGLCNKSESKFVYDLKDKVKLYPIITKGSFGVNIRRVFLDIIGKRKQIGGYSFYKQYNFLKICKRLSSNKYDIVVLEWTDSLLLIKEIKKIFPSAKFVCSEHDVTFLRYYREYMKNPNNDNKWIYEDGKNKELTAISMCDKVMPHNYKDAELLISNNVSQNKIHVLVPYFHNMKSIQRKTLNHDVLFWGAMNRQDNYEAAIWFINNVMPFLKDTDVSFIVAGNNPPAFLKELESEKVRVLGFVEDESYLFESSLCMVVPLLNGAGIKVKTIEGLSAGIPVLTNEIGAEGIPLTDKENYILCNNAKDYVDAILKLYQDMDFAFKIGENGRNVIQQNFDLSKSENQYYKMLKELSNEK